MKVKINDIIEAVELDSDMSQSYLNTKTGLVCVFADEEIQAVEEGDDLTDSPDWYREAVARAKAYFENQNDYLPLPTKYDFDEYRIIEKFIRRVAVAEQAEMLYQAIQGKGAFRRFKTMLEQLG